MKYYLDLNNISNKQIREDLNIPYTTFIDWMNGVSYPKEETLKNIANYLNVDDEALKNPSTVELMDLKKLFEDNYHHLEHDDIERIKYIIVKRLNMKINAK